MVTYNTDFTDIATILLDIWPHILPRFREIKRWPQGYVQIVCRTIFPSGEMANQERKEQVATSLIRIQDASSSSLESENSCHEVLHDVFWGFPGNSRDHDGYCFLPHNFQFIIYQSYHLMIHNHIY